MKLISLNTWGGVAGNDKLLAFFDTHRDIDIFCLQEVWNGGSGWIADTSHRVKHLEHMEHIEEIDTRLLKHISTILPDHRSYFRPHFSDFWGLAVFIKKDLSVIEEGEQYVYRHQGWVSDEHPGDHARNIQYLRFTTPLGVRTVLNFHGLWRLNATKGDLPDRVEQSKRIIAFTTTLADPFVMCGDFNLMPETESIRILEEGGLRNLIKEYRIPSTRTRYYPKAEPYADYAFVSPGIMVNDFKVLPDEVSDHSPMFLDFE